MTRVTAWGVTNRCHDLPFRFAELRPVNLACKVPLPLWAALDRPHSLPVASRKERELIGEIRDHFGCMRRKTATQWERRVRKVDVRSVFITLQRRPSALPRSV